MIDYTFKKYVDFETGEIREGVFTDKELIENDRKRREYAEYKDKTRTETPFTFYFMSAIRELLEELRTEPRMKNTYLGYLLILNTYLNYENVLYQHENAKKPLNRGGIKKVLKIGNRQTSKKFIDLMLEKGVLKEVKTDNGKGFAMNEKYTLRGSTDDPQKVKVFNKTIRQMYEDNTASDFSFIYSLIPYVEFNHNILCRNPYEKDPSKLETLTIDDVMELTDVSQTTAYDKLNKLKLDGQPVFITVKTGGGYYYVANPDVLARKYFAKDDKIRALFKPKAISPNNIKD